MAYHSCCNCVVMRNDEVMIHTASPLTLSHCGILTIGGDTTLGLRTNCITDIIQIYNNCCFMEREFF